MSSTDRNPRGELLAGIVEQLLDSESYVSLIHQSRHDVPMPSVDSLEEVISLLKAVLFPGYFGPSDLRPETLAYHVGATLDRVIGLLWEQIKRGFCYACVYDGGSNCSECDNRARRLTTEFLSRLPEIRRLLATDVDAAFEGDPAALQRGETIYCYPSIRAMINHRIAHEFYNLEIPLIPRIIAERAHSVTGIDIHPGATIGERFFMDHGTGIVIGETAVIGKDVRIYQGVTLGAKSFPLDAEGNPVKGVSRHPIVEDRVIIYAGATILGRITIGTEAVIGGNVWVTRDVPPGSRLQQGRLTEYPRTDGSGI